MFFIQKTIKIPLGLRAEREREKKGGRRETKNILFE